LSEENNAISENKVSETTAAEEDIESLKRNLAEEKDKANKHLANWQRAEADFSNYKKRVEQERNETITFANGDLIRALLPVLDDMERALASLPPKLEPGWVDGIKLVHRKFRTVLESQGVTEVETIDKPFDTNLHEALAQVEGAEGMVVNEIQKGYKLKDKLLRPTLVTIGKGKTKNSKSKANEEKPREASEA